MLEAQQQEKRRHQGRGEYRRCARAGPEGQRKSAGASPRRTRETPPGDVKQRAPIHRIATPRTASSRYGSRIEHRGVSPSGWCESSQVHSRRHPGGQAIGDRHERVGETFGDGARSDRGHRGRVGGHRLLLAVRRAAWRGPRDHAVLLRRGALSGYLLRVWALPRRWTVPAGALRRLPLLHQLNGARGAPRRGSTPLPPTAVELITPGRHKAGDLESVDHTESRRAGRGGRCRSRRAEAARFEPRTLTGPLALVG